MSDCESYRGGNLFTETHGSSKRLDGVVLPACVPDTGVIGCW